MNKYYSSLPNKVLISIVIVVALLYFVDTRLIHFDIKKLLILVGSLFMIPYGLFAIFTRKTWVVTPAGFGTYLAIKGIGVVIFGCLSALLGLLLLYGYFTYL